MQITPTGASGFVGANLQTILKASITKTINHLVGKAPDLKLLLIY